MTTKPLFLYIEDVASNLPVMMGVCERMGVDLIIAEDGFSGLKLLEERRPTLVLLDIGLPDMDGIEVVQHIRANKDPEIARVKVIAVTAHAMNGDRDRCLNAGCDAYVSKPYKVSVITALMEKMLEPYPQNS